MRRRKVVVAPEALADLSGIYRGVRINASELTARRYVARIRRAIRSLATASQRGHDHRDVEPGLRSMGFEGRIQIAFEVLQDEVIVVNVFYAGQNWESALKQRANRVQKS